MQYNVSQSTGGVIVSECHPLTQARVTVSRPPPQSLKLSAPPVPMAELVRIDGDMFEDWHEEQK